MLLEIEIIITIGYLLYIQFSPQMGNIWWRNDYFSPLGAFKVIIYPLQESKMWLPEFWDINYFIWLIVGLLLYVLCSKLYNKNDDDI